MLPQMLGYIQTKPYARMCSEKNCRKISMSYCTLLAKSLVNS